MPRSRKTRARYRVAVIGSGSWATAIVKIISVNLEHIHWWVRKEEVAESIIKYGHNPKYLSSVFSKFFCCRFIHYFIFIHYFVSFHV